jgi:2-haloacid dehalogenase
MPSRPVAVAFDVMQTLFSLEPLRPSLVSLGLPPDSLELWYTRILRDGASMAAAGGFKPFRDVAAGNLEIMLADRQPPAGAGAIDEFLRGLAELPAEPDVPPALARLADAGIRLVALTNGNGGVTKQLAERAGILDRFEHIVSIEDVGRWKPHPEVYRHAARVAGVEPSRLGLVASHAWDTHGAKRAGLFTAWFPRKEALYHPALEPPDLRSHSLPDLCEKLVGLPIS